MRKNLFSILSLALIISFLLSAITYADYDSESVINSIRNTSNDTEPAVLPENALYAIDTLPAQDGALSQFAVYYPIKQANVYDSINGGVVKNIGKDYPVLILERQQDWVKMQDGWMHLDDLIFSLDEKKDSMSISEELFYKKEVEMLKEYADAEIKYMSPTAIVASNKVTENDYVYYLTHILIKDGGQLKGGQSFDKWGGEQEKPTDFAKRKNAFLVINGSYFSYATGTPLASPAGIYDNNIASDATANGSEICISKDGSLFSPYNGDSLDVLIDLGVTATLSTADPLLIAYGQKKDFSYRNDDVKYPRSAIGEVAAGEYYLVTAGNGNYKGGMSYTDLQNVFYDLGCVYARSFDGGGSAALVIDKNLINTPAAGSERPVADFLYFVD